MSEFLCTSLRVIISIVPKIEETIDITSDIQKIYQYRESLIEIAAGLEKQEVAQKIELYRRK